MEKWDGGVGGNVISFATAAARLGRARVGAGLESRVAQVLRAAKDELARPDDRTGPDSVIATVSVQIQLPERH